MCLFLLLSGCLAGCQQIGLLFHAGEVLGDILHANVLETLPACHDAVVESNIRVAAAQLVDFETFRAFIADVETFAVAFGRQEGVIFDTWVDGLRESGLETNDDRTV
jgi:hypothetical protein